MSIHTGFSDGVTVEYDAPTIHDGMALAAYVRINVESARGSYSLVLDMEDARAVAEQVPALVMAHDAAERIRTEQIAAEKSAAEPKAA